MRKIIAVTSGKGGAGKTCVSLNLAISLCKMGRRVCLFDADLGLANVNILLGLEPELTVHDLLDRGKSLEDVMISGSSGLEIIPGGAMIAKLSELEDQKYMEFLKKFEVLEQFDFMIVDTSGGITTSNMAFSLSADETIVVFGPDSTSLRDEFAVIKIMLVNKYAGRIYGLPNNFITHKRAAKSFDKIHASVKKFLNRSIDELPYISADPSVDEAVVSQEAFIELFPETQGSQAITEIADRVEQGGDDLNASNPSFYIQEVIRSSNNQALIKYVDMANASIAKRNKKNQTRLEQQTLTIAMPSEKEAVQKAAPADVDSSPVDSNESEKTEPDKKTPFRPAPSKEAPADMKVEPIPEPSGEAAPAARVEPLDRAEPEKVNANISVNLSDIKRVVSDSTSLPAAILESQKSISMIMEKNIVMHEKVIETLLNFASGANGNGHSNGSVPANGNGHSKGGKVIGKARTADEQLLSTEEGLNHLTTEYLDIDEYISTISVSRNNEKEQK